MSPLRPGLRGFAVALAAGAALSGCGGAGTRDSASSASPSDTIGVQASEMKFDLTTSRAPAGKVTFNVENTGAVPHEMVVIRTPTPAGDIPEKNGERDETGAVGQIGAAQLQPGSGASLTRTLTAGHYALICALPGHYEAGMYTDLTVE